MMWGRHNILCYSLYSRRTVRRISVRPELNGSFRLNYELYIGLSSLLSNTAAPIHIFAVSNRITVKFFAIGPLVQEVSCRFPEKNMNAFISCIRDLG